MSRTEPQKKHHVPWGLISIAGFALGWIVVDQLRRRIDSETLQRRFWDPMYDRGAPLYDAVDWFTGNTTQRLRLRVLEHLPAKGSQLLEVGFGSGKLHAELAGSYTMAGLDAAAGMVALTQRRLDSLSLSSDLRHGDMCALPWPDAHFDAVFSTFAFSAVADADQALDEMVRVIKPGGKVIIVDAGESERGTPFAHVLARLWAFFGDYIRDEVPLLEARGLSVTREEYGPGGCVHIVSGVKA